jgi:hypothetical protein
MISAAQRGAWMTLGEIAGLTEIGEASISAQLRHLRKPRHGRHRVEKRRRRIRVSWDGRPRPAEASFTRGARGDAKRRAGGEAVIWEYRVLPPSGWNAIARARSHEEETRRQAANAIGASEILSLAQSSETEEARGVANGRSEPERGGEGASAGIATPDDGEVSNAEACN